VNGGGLVRAYRVNGSKPKRLTEVRYSSLNLTETLSPYKILRGLELSGSKSIGQTEKTLSGPALFCKASRTACGSVALTMF